MPPSPSRAKTKIVPPVMILIPEGEFIMGTSDLQVAILRQHYEWADEWYEQDLFEIEQPQHTVYMPAFEIGRYPVTNAEYYAYVHETSSRAPRFWKGFSFSAEVGDHPVVGITKQQALDYCKWLSKKLGNEFRLPTEAEWERAARGSSGRIYPWGDSFDPWRCNTSESGKNSTTPITLYSPAGDSPTGASDMVGNVWEWTSSQLHPYPYDPEDGREDQTKNEECVVRGGAWYYSQKLARCSTREAVLSTYQSNSLGFRLARTPRELEK